MTAEELIDEINELSENVTTMSGEDGNSGEPIDSKTGYYAFVNDKGNVECKYSYNGYVSDNIFVTNFDAKTFELSEIMISTDNTLPNPRLLTASLFSIIIDYLENGDWLPPKKFREKEIKNISEKINNKKVELNELKAKLNALKDNK